MTDILDNKLAVIAHHTKEARAILDDERADMRRECEARVALAVAERDTAIAQSEKVEARTKAGISAHDDVDAAGWVERVATALGLWYEYDHGPFIANESAEVVARIEEDKRRLASLDKNPAPSNARVVHVSERDVVFAWSRWLASVNSDEDGGRGGEITVPQAVALQALLGDHLPEGAIVIEGSSPLDPEERTEGPWVVAASKKADTFWVHGGHGWTHELAQAQQFELKPVADDVANVQKAVVITHAEALKVTP